MGSVSQAQIAEFKESGHLTVADVLTADEVEALAARTDMIAAGAAEHVPAASIQLEPVFRS
ncbi:MAG: phytanoyl-CoA dioxygenase, partial [Candidatus Latescibacteria bacterium]|nr:phytanoyl-CoA dioxygenase [Candidatus Latescibacterota bacterium]